MVGGSWNHKYDQGIAGSLIVVQLSGDLGTCSSGDADT
jgi:hypothetical protein